LLKAGYLEKWNYRPTLSGTPQGGIVSPILANIYLDKFDTYVEKTLIPEYTRGRVRKSNPEYARASYEVEKAREKGEPAIVLRNLIAGRNALPSRQRNDPGYRRLRYIRYADDFLLGFAGPREEAEEIRTKIGTFLRDNLKLDMSPEKTLITHARTEQARFLGYDVSVNPHRFGRDGIILNIPPDKLEAKIDRYMKDGKPVHRPELLAESDFSIIHLYGDEFQGFVQYYGFARNRYWLNRLQWVMETSMLKTLAAKHKSSVQKMARKFKSEHYHKGKTMRCFETIVERPGKEPLIARFGGIRLSTEPLLMIEDRPLDYRIGTRAEILLRLLADTCDLCGSNENIQVHHIRKLADLKVKGRKTPTYWQQTMASRRRKTLMVCQKCHTAIHSGQPMMDQRRSDAKINE